MSTTSLNSSSSSSTGDVSDDIIAHATQKISDNMKAVQRIIKKRSITLRRIAAHIQNNNVPPNLRNRVPIIEWPSTISTEIIIAATKEEENLLAECMKRINETRVKVITDDKNRHELLLKNYGVGDYLKTLYIKEIPQIATNPEMVNQLVRDFEGIHTANTAEIQEKDNVINGEKSVNHEGNKEPQLIQNKIMDQLKFLTNAVNEIQKNYRGAGSRSPRRNQMRDSTSPIRKLDSSYTKDTRKQDNHTNQVRFRNNDYNTRKYYTNNMKDQKNQYGQRMNQHYRDTRFNKPQEIDRRYYPRRGMTEDQQTVDNTAKNSYITEDEMNEDEPEQYWRKNRTNTSSRETRQRDM
jgi:hypothetical protein